MRTLFVLVLLVAGCGASSPGGVVVVDGGGDAATDSAVSAPLCTNCTHCPGQPVQGTPTCNEVDYGTGTIPMPLTAGCSIGPCSRVGAAGGCRVGIGTAWLYGDPNADGVVVTRNACRRDAMWLNP